MINHAKSMGRPSPKIFVSWGELIDKITILEIKADLIKAESARKNVLKELAYIRDIADAELASDGWMAERMSALKKVNAALWDIEDRIRAKDRAGAFDQEFVDLARSVYKLNDERAAIKKQINVHLSSEFVEEKSYQSY